MRSVSDSNGKASGVPKNGRVTPEYEQELRARAAEYTAQGISVLPTQKGKKNPSTNWRNWSKGVANARLAQKHLDEALRVGETDGLFVPLGRSSGNLVVVEWEGKAEEHLKGVEQHFRDSLIRNGYGELADRVLIGGHVEQSPSGGVHLHLRVKGECPRGKRLATSSGDDVLAELKAQGNGVVVAPTSARAEHLERGLTQGYQTNIGCPESTPTVTQKELEVLCDTLTQLLDQKQRRTDSTPPEKPSRPEVRVERASESGVDRYSRLVGWDELLTACRFTRVRTDGQHTYYDRPDEPQRGSISVAVVGDDTSGTLYVHHTGLSALVGGESYTKQGFIAAWEFGGTSEYQLKQAAKFMQEEYGARSDSSLKIAAYEEGNETFIDLSWVAEGVRPATVETSSMQRKDLHFLGYRGARINLLYGDPESGKSWVLYAETKAELERGGRVVLLSVDFEDVSESASRLLALEVEPAVIGNPSRLRFYQPETTQALKVVLAEVEKFDPTLVVIDSLGGMLTMLGLDSLKDSDVRGAWREYVHPFGERSEGCAVWVIDHLTKKQAQGRNTDSPYGSAAKKQLVRGAMIRAEVSDPLAPEHLGRVNLYVEKDNSGKVRQVSSSNGYLGCFTLDSTKGKTTYAEIASPDEVREKKEKFVPTYYAQRVSEFLEMHGTQSGRQIENGVEGKKAMVTKALEYLVKGEWVQEREAQAGEGRGGGKRYSSLKPYRETDDPNSDKWVGNFIYEPNRPPTDPQLTKGSERTSELSYPPIGVSSSEVQGEVVETVGGSEWSEPLSGGAA